MDISEDNHANEDSCDEEFDVDRKTRRSSILKPLRKSGSEENNDFTMKTSRRVSFASSNFIKPFAADPEKNTIWDLTYEEEVNHTDSAKSLSEKSDVLNMSSITISEDVKELNATPTTNSRIPFLPLTIEEHIINKENIFISTDNVEDITKRSVAMELTKVVSTKMFHKSTVSEICNKSDSDLEFTGTLHNIIEMKPASEAYHKAIKNYLQSSEGTIHFEDSQYMDITEYNNNPIYENQLTSVKGILKNKSVNQTVFFNNEDQDMELTTTLLPLNNQQIQSENRIPELANKNIIDPLVQNKENVFKLPDSTNNNENKIEKVEDVGMDIDEFSNRRTTIHFQDHENSMDITSEICQIEQRNDFSKTTNHNNESNMELTLVATSCEVVSTVEETKDYLKRTMSDYTYESNKSTKTIHYQDTEGGMELTSNFVSGEIVEKIQKDTDDKEPMELSLRNIIKNTHVQTKRFLNTTDTSLPEKIVTNVEEKLNDPLNKKLINVTKPDEEISKTVDETELLNRKTFDFQGDGNSMEFTLVSPSHAENEYNEDFKNVTHSGKEKSHSHSLVITECDNVQQSHEENAKKVKKLRRTIHFHDDSGSLEFTSILPSQAEVKTDEDFNSGGKESHLYSKGVITECNNAQEIYEESVKKEIKNPLKRRTIHFHDDNNSMEFTSVLPSCEEIKIKDNKTDIRSEEETSHLNLVLIEKSNETLIKESESNKIRNSDVDIPPFVNDQLIVNDPLSLAEPMKQNSFTNEQKTDKLIQMHSLAQQIETEENDNNYFETTEHKSGKNIIHTSDANKETTSGLKTNILYTTPGKIKIGLSKFDSSDYHQFALTPTTFGINYGNCSSGTDDTQQLIHATVPKKIESSKVDYFESMVDKLDQTKRELADTTPVSMIDTSIFSYINQDEKTVENSNTCKVHEKNSIRKLDITSECSVVSLQHNGTDINEISNVNNVVETDFTLITDQNYTIRSQNILNNIKTYLSPPVEDKEATKNKQKKIDDMRELIRQNGQKIEERCKTLFREIDSVSLQDMLKETREEIEKRKISLDANCSDNTVPILDVMVPKSIYERICEVANRCDRQWVFIKSESKDDCYYFSVLNNTVNILVNIFPDSGVVDNIKTFQNNLDGLRPIKRYNAKVFQYKMKNENLLSALGDNFEILTLLDYVSMAIEEISNFNKEFQELRDKYRKSHKLEMDSNFNVLFKILSVRYMMWWEITIRMSLFNIGHPESVTAKHQMGEKINEDDIKVITQNTLGGQTFLRNFIENVEEYKEKMVKKIKFKINHN